MSMLPVFVELLSALALAAVGLACGWWLRSRTPLPATANPDEVNRARQVLGQLREVAVSMAANVDQHSTRVQAINQELISSEGQESEAVVATVAKLIAANRDMQQQLNTAEGKLREQTLLVETREAEARTDPLTGLWNRRALDDEMPARTAAFQRDGRRFAFVLGDIDHFKRVNDTYGHPAGDEVLRGVARVLRGAARQQDMVVRYGGEEFAVLLSDAELPAATEIVERLREAVAAASFQYGDQTLKVTVSFGTANLLKGEQAGELIQRADDALYAAKKGGRNQTVWHDGQATQLVPKLSAEPQPAAEVPHATEATQTESVPSAETPRTESQLPAVAEEPPAAPPEAAEPPRPQRTRALCSRSEFCLSLNRRLSEWRRGGAAPAVLLVRIDTYPALVARYGRQAGTLMLRATSQFLAAAIRDMDLAGDYDDATFAMLLPGASLANVIGVAERLRQAIARCALPVSGGVLKFTVSVGGAATIQSDEAQTLLWRVEESLEAAAKNSGNCSYFHNGQWAETAAALMDRTHITPA
jgi:diguanylate cyclase